MTDPTPEPYWPPHAARRHVQEPTPDAQPAAMTVILDEAWEDGYNQGKGDAKAEAESEVARLRAEVDALRASLTELALSDEVLVEDSYFQRADLPRILANYMRACGQAEGEAKQWAIRAERAEKIARGKQAVIEAQRATLDRVRAEADALNRDAAAAKRSARRVTREVGRLLEAEAKNLFAILDAPQSEAGGDDE